MESKLIKEKDRVEWKNEMGGFHREDGPAIEYNNGSNSWWINGKLHREDGPAIESMSGVNYWYLNGIEYTEEEFHQEIIKIKLNRLINERRISR